MGKFLASRAVSELEYDLSPHVMSKGTIPEPSDKLLARFQKRTAELAQKYQPDVDFNDQAAVLEVLASQTEEQSEESAREMAEAFAELTQGTPNSEELMALPPRVRQAFYGWLQSEVSPEG